MKRIWMLTAALLLLSAGCSASTDPQSLAALENVMAVAAYSDGLPEEPPAADPVCWDGDYGNGSRTITLSLGANGSLHYRVSDGGVGCAAEVNGTAAKTSSLCFSLSGDTLSVVGGIYTGNYERQLNP